MHSAQILSWHSMSVRVVPRLMHMQKQLCIGHTAGQSVRVTHGRYSRKNEKMNDSTSKPSSRSSNESSMTICVYDRVNIYSRSILPVSRSDDSPYENRKKSCIIYSICSHRYSPSKNHTTSWVSAHPKTSSKGSLGGSICSTVSSRHVSPVMESHFPLVENARSRMRSIRMRRREYSVIPSSRRPWVDHIHSDISIISIVPVSHSREHSFRNIISNTSGISHENPAKRSSQGNSWSGKSGIRKILPYNLHTIIPWHEISLLHILSMLRVSRITARRTHQE